MSSCAECERTRRYMAADPEMYRGEDSRCSAHRRVPTPPEVESAEEFCKRFSWWWRGLIEKEAPRLVEERDAAVEKRARKGMFTRKEVLRIITLARWTSGRGSREILETYEKERRDDTL